MRFPQIISFRWQNVSHKPLSLKDNILIPDAFHEVLSYFWIHKFIFKPCFSLPLTQSTFQSQPNDFSFGAKNIFYLRRLRTHLLRPLGKNTWKRSRNMLLPTIFSLKGPRLQSKNGWQYVTLLLPHIRTSLHSRLHTKFICHTNQKQNHWLAVKRIFSQHVRITYFQTNPVWIQNNEISQGMDWQFDKSPHPPQKIIPYLVSNFLFYS